MVVSKKTLTKVKDMGLNSYEAKIWTALLSRGVSTAGEISDIANVPRSRSYDVLESLEQKGFITRKIGKPIQYIALNPDEVIERRKKDIRQEAEEQVEVLEDFEQSELLDNLKELHDEGVEHIDPTEITGYIKGQQNITSHITMMIDNAKETITYANIINTEPIKTAIDNALQRDVTVTKADKQGRMLVIDQHKSLIYITDDAHENYETAIWVESQPLAQILTPQTGTEEHMKITKTPTQKKTT